MLNVALIGVSGFAKVHYGDLVREHGKGRMNPAAVAVLPHELETPQVQNLKALGAQVFTDYREMLRVFAGKLDLCLIPTGIHLHAPMTIAALESGANVFVEKPAAAVIQDVLAMQAAEKRTGKFVAVGYQTMYASETLRMKDALLSGKIGTVRSVKYWGLWRRLVSYYERNNWAGKLKNGETWVLDSPLNNALSHQLNMVCFLAGKTRERSAAPVAVTAEMYRAHNIESFDTGCLRVETEDGPSVFAVVTHACAEHEGPVIEAVGNKGKMVWHISGPLRFEFSDGSVEESAIDNNEQVRNNLMDALVARCEGKNSFLCGLDVAGTHTLVINAAHESASVVPVPAALVDASARDESTQVVIRGIADLVRRSFKEEKTFSELGVPWAKPGARIVIDQYDAFPRTGCPAAVS